MSYIETSKSAFSLAVGFLIIGIHQAKCIAT